MADFRIEKLKDMLEDSRYTVAVCGSGMMTENGFMGIKTPEKAYAIEEKYGASPEEIFTSSYYNTRTRQFFEFYREEILADLTPSASAFAMAAMEKAGKLQCIISSNIYEFSQRGGCSNVINLHGSIYQNQCPHCKKMYSMEYIKNSKSVVPLCENCGHVIRPLVSLFGEMVDSQKMTSTTEEIEKADMLILLGTHLDSEVFGTYIRYFEGRYLAVIHKDEKYADEKADLVIHDEPKNILPLLGY